MLFKSNSKRVDLSKLLFSVLINIGNLIEVLISFNFFQVSSNKFFRLEIKNTNLQHH